MEKVKQQGKIVRRLDQVTVAVEIIKVSRHGLYGKKVVKSRTYLVHDTKGEAKVGEVVAVEECRPISKLKRWKIHYDS